MNAAIVSLPLAVGPLLRLPLSEVLRAEIALLLQACHLFSVGDFLRGWHDPRRRCSIEHAFDHPRQAQQAAATCAAWLGAPPPADRWGMSPWWCRDLSESVAPDPSGREPARDGAWVESQVVSGWV